jgi:WD40 repeat protein
MMAVMAEFERDQVSERTKTALQHKKSKGEISLGYSFGSIKILDICKEQYNFTFKGSNNKIHLIYAHPYINSLILSIQKKLSRFWNFSPDLNKIQILSFFQPTPVVSCSFRPHGKLIDFADSSNQIKCFDIECQRWIGRNTFVDRIFCINNNKNGRLLCIGKQNGISVFDLRINKEVIVFFSKSNSILYTEWINQEQRILASGTSGVVSLWDLRNIKKEKKIKCHNDFLNFVKIFSSSDLILTSGNNKKITLWNIQNNKKIRKLHKHKKNITSVDLSENKRILCSSGLDKKTFITYY